MVAPWRPPLCVAAMTPMTLAALDDFISPGQECVKPLVSAPSAKRRGLVRMDQPGQYTEVDEQGQNEVALPKASITLQDCLACSGCITSAESVLITAQSVDEFLTRVKAVRERSGLIVVSVAPEARASIAAHYGLPDVLQCQRKLVTLFDRLGARYVFDTTFAKRIHVLESRLEADRAEPERAHRTLLSR